MASGQQCCNLSINGDRRLLITFLIIAAFSTIILSRLTGPIPVKQRAASVTVPPPRYCYECNLAINTRNKSIPVAKTPPWFELMNPTNASNNSSSPQRLLYMTTGNGGRLGNQMFGYASLFGVAWRNKRIPIWHNDHGGLLKAFKHIRIPTNHESSHRHSEFTVVNESHAIGYNNETESLPPTNIHMSGYFQNTRYFAHVEDQIRYDFTFADDVMRQAQSMLDMFNASSLRDQGFARVIIHVRRTDFTSVLQPVLNNKPDFFNISMTYFTDCLPNAQFIVISDDIPWCRQNIVGQRVDFIDGERSPAVDLAIASLCDHAIITVGSFGWWVAWFAGGVILELTDIPNENNRAPVDKCGFIRPKTPQ